MQYLSLLNKIRNSEKEEVTGLPRSRFLTIVLTAVVALVTKTNQWQHRSSSHVISIGFIFIKKTVS